MISEQEAKGKATGQKIGADVAIGVRAIADETGMTKRQIYHLVHTGNLPGAFKLGGRWALS